MPTIVISKFLIFKLLLDMVFFLNEVSLILEIQIPLLDMLQILLCSPNCAPACGMLHKWTMLFAFLCIIMANGIRSDMENGEDIKDGLARITDDLLQFHLLSNHVFIECQKLVSIYTYSGKEKESKFKARFCKCSVTSSCTSRRERQDLLWH